MASDIGPGTRLLCVGRAPFLVVNNTYTCVEVTNTIEWCQRHGRNPTCFGIRVTEVSVEDMTRITISNHPYYCSELFVPLGGDLHESLRMENIVKGIKASPVKELEDA